MTDPIQHAAVSACTPAVAVSCAMMNIVLWPFGITFVFAFVALTYAETNNVGWLKSLQYVMASTLIGGSAAQIMAKPMCLYLGSLITSIKPWADNAEIAMMAGLAIVFGLVLHKLMPVLLNRLAQKVGEQKAGEQ